MKRIGYDADTMRYYFRDQDGSVWQGAEGSEFGEMIKGAEEPFHVVNVFLNLFDSQHITFIYSTTPPPTTTTTRRPPTTTIIH